MFFVNSFNFIIEAIYKAIYNGYSEAIEVMISHEKV